MDATRQISAQLDDRRVRLCMSKADLARRSDVSQPTVRRVLSGQESRPRTDTVIAIATALGVEVRLSENPDVHETHGVSEFRRAQAKAKARRLARLVQGTMALEAEAVGVETLAALEEDNLHALLAGSGRRLWGE